MGKVSHAKVLQLIQTFLKAAILTKGSDIVITADQTKRAETEFDLKIVRMENGWRLALKQGAKDGSGGLSLPEEPRLWTPD